MPVHIASRWAAERPRSASLSAFAVGCGHDRLRRSYAHEASLEALDLDTRVLSNAPVRKVSTTRHLPLRPLPRPVAAPRTVERFVAEAEHVQASAAPPRYAAAYLLPHEKAGVPPWAELPWPDANVTLFNGDGARYVLLRSGLRRPRGILDWHETGAEPPHQLRRLGPNSVLSVVAIHDDTNRRPVRPGARFQFRHPVWLAVCKTFSLDDVACEANGRRLPRRSSWAEIGRELAYSMVPGNDYLEGRGLNSEDASRPAHDARPRWPAASERPPAPSRSLPATAFEPVRMLRQHDHTGNFVHLLYPVSGYDGGDLLEFFRLHNGALTPLEARASHQMLGHALLAEPLESVCILHEAPLFHQDLRIENLLFDTYVDFGPPAVGRGPGGARRLLLPKIQAHLIDFGHTTPNLDGSVAVSTIYTHAPESFPSAAAYANNLAARRFNQPAPPGSSYDRAQDDIWAFGMLLLRLLTPQMEPPRGYEQRRWFACPLVADYEGDLHRYAPDGTTLPGLDPNKLNANHNKAQALRKRWGTVHAAWAGWHARRAGGSGGERPQSAPLPTPNGAMVDAALGQVADMEFDFLGLLLSLLAPGRREPLHDVLKRYGKQVEEVDESYDPVKRAARNVLLRRLHPWSRTGSFTEQIWSRSIEAINADIHASKHIHFEAEQRTRVRSVAHPGGLRPPLQAATTAHALAQKLYALPHPRAAQPRRGQSPASPFRFNVDDGARGKRRTGAHSPDSATSTDPEDAPGLASDFGSPPSSDFMPMTPELRGGFTRVLYGSPDARHLAVHGDARRGSFTLGKRPFSGAPA